MNLGISPVGILFLAALFVPNIIWARDLPEGYEELSRGESRVLLILERVGQVLTTVAAIIFVPTDEFGWPSLAWLLVALVLMILYEIAWARYFRHGRSLGYMYAPLGPIPVPIATLPVIAFILLGIWCGSPVLVLSAAILGVGHIGIHARHYRELRDRGLLT
ncbi:MAG: hypothetical protein ACOYIK_08395 [Coriobacteriales bacterium]|jgi:hypothetical protein